MKSLVLFVTLLAMLGVACQPSPTPAPSRPVFPSPPVGTPSSAIPSPQVTTLAATVVLPTAMAVSQPTILQRLTLLDLPGSGRGPSALARMNNTLYVANRNSANLAVIRDNRVQSYIPTAGGPDALVADPTAGRLYVGTYISPTLSIIERDAIVKTQEIPGPVESLALYRDRLLVGLGTTPEIQVRDATTLELQRTIKLSAGFDVLRLVVDDTRNRVYAGIYGQVIVLDAATLAEDGAIPAPGFTGSLAVNPKDGNLWVGIYDEGEHRGAVVEYDEFRRPIRKILLDDDLRGAIFDSHDRLWVASAFTNRVTAVDAASGNVVKRVTVGLSPGAVIFDQIAGVIYVANEASDSVSQIDTEDSLELITTYPVGMRLTALATDEEGRVFASNLSDGSVFIAQIGKPNGVITTNGTPVDLARDPKSHRLFAANAADGSVSVIFADAFRFESAIPVTSTLSTVAVDAANRRLFAGSTMLELDDRSVLSTFLAKGQTVGSLNRAVLVRADPARRKIYAVASNGVPGSNSRMILYSFSEDDPASSFVMPYKNGGNITALVVDEKSGRVYAAATHPLSYHHALIAWDANGNNIAEIPLGSRATGLALNPATSHLFLAHSNTYPPYNGPLPKRDNSVQILDTRTLGDVAWVDVPGSPGPMTVSGNTVFVAGQDDGVLTAIADAAMPAPPAPTPLPTSTPYPTLTPAIKPTGAAVPPSPSPTAASFTCSFEPGKPFLSKYNSMRPQLGCASAQETEGAFAYQGFSGGFMLDDLRDPTAQGIYVFTFGAPNRYRTFPDSWAEGQPSDSCTGTPVLAPLVKPIRGFGKVWCANPDVREALPGATAQEQAVTMRIQKFEKGMIWASSAIGIVALLDDGTWQ